MGSGIRFVSLTKELYKTWDSFCEDVEDAWFWHTSKWLDYNLAYRPSLRPISQSFMVYDDDSIVAVCPVIVQIVSTDVPELKVIAYPSGHGMMPVLAPWLTSSMQKHVLQACLEHLDELAKLNQVKHITLWATPLISRIDNDFGMVSRYLDSLRRAGYIDSLWLTSIVDLSGDKQMLRKSMRKGHRYDTKRGEQKFITEVYQGARIERALFDQYAVLHELAAGRKTRPDVTFDMMYSWILEGKAMLILTKHNEMTVGANLVILYKDAGYYASSCMHPEYINDPVGHAMHWAAMCWMKDKGYRWYELGLIRYGIMPHDLASEKEVRISHYERGFGGAPVMCLVAEKYFSRDYYMRVNQERAIKYSIVLSN